MKAFAFVLLALIAAVHADGEDNRWVYRPVGECPLVDGETPVYLEDKSARNLFYECNSGKPVLLRCPLGMVYNPRVKVCDRPCRDCEPFGPIGRCPNTDGLFLRDGSNVAVYYTCDGDQPVKHTCEDETIFNTLYNACHVYGEY